jgi:FkbM family methyltransferase
MNDELVDFSEFGQPAALMGYLPPTVPRVLVDVGAYDGIQGSNSRQFLLDGWRGVLIEPIPALYELLRTNSRELADVHLFNCAVANRNGRAAMKPAMRPRRTHQCISATPTMRRSRSKF